MSFFSSVFGGGHADAPDIQPLLSFYNSQYSSRLQDIDQFSKQLESYNTSFSNALGNLYNLAYARHAGNLNAAYGAKGMDVNGGAFAAELARASADYQAQMEPQIYQNAVGAAGEVDNRRQNAFNQYTNAYGGALGQSIFTKYNRQQTLDDRFSQSMGNMLGSAVGSFAGGYAGGNPFTMAGAKLGGQAAGASAADWAAFNASEAGTAAMYRRNSLFQ